ncbi:hypothetical protein [Streptomyces sp. NPDC008121]|uniref:hypothetical protein n=1 Tax=Streptomyces sp. NPDC008121 TaxID=3364809 RepID=UPI0036E8C774
MREFFVPQANGWYCGQAEEAYPITRDSRHVFHAELGELVQSAANGVDLPRARLTENLAVAVYIANGVPIFVCDGTGRAKHGVCGVAEDEVVRNFGK